MLSQTTHTRKRDTDTGAYRSRAVSLSAQVYDVPKELNFSESVLHEHELVYSLHVLQTRLSQVYLAYRLAVYSLHSVAVAGTFVARVMDANQHLLLRISIYASRAFRVHIV